MFSKDSSAGGDRGAPAPSTIGASLRVVGDLAADGDVQVDGTVEGDVHAAVLTVSEGGAVKGVVLARAVHVRGIVEGRIKADSVNIGRTARVVGDIVHGDLAVEAGAFVDGHCRRREAGGKAPPLKGEGVGKVPPEPASAPA